MNKNRPSVDQDLSTPVLIIGGGIAGLMCAYQFMKNKIQCILVESRNLASGVSANTTAQLSIAHDKIYMDIAKKHGKSAALSYLSSQIDGLNIIKRIIDEEQIECDYREESTILCANEEKNIETIKKQYEMIQPVFPNCHLITKQNDIIDYKIALEFQRQAIFNPLKYMMKIIDILIENHIPLYENSQVTKIKKEKEFYRVTIHDTYTIKADKIIMACHYPFLNPDNLYFTKIYQSSSYAVAFKTKLKLTANYIFLDKPYYYLRTYDDSTLIIGGQDHYTGLNIDIHSCYNNIIRKIYELDQDAAIVCKWFTEDCMPIDSLPFIGSYSKQHPNILLITGFQKWGFTNSHMAALEVTNHILGKSYNILYKTNRWIILKNPKGLSRMILHSMDGLVLSKLFVRQHPLSDIPVGSGKVTKYKNNHVLAYRENKNEYIILKNKCTHMGCSLIWNDADKVWVSKCHGSIFDKYGHVIYGPALQDLERLNL